MPIALPTRVPSVAEVAALGAQQTVELLNGYAQTIDALRHQIEWFKRQLFGQKSERVAPAPDPQQMHLGQVLGQELPVPAQQHTGQQVPAHTRRKPHSDFTDDSASAPFFDESKVPVQTIEVPNPEAQGLAPEQYEVIGQKVSHRLAQRPGSFVVLKYVRPVIKRHDTQTLHCAPAPMGIIEGSRADVSFIAGVLVDKFAWHRVLRTRSPP